VSIESFLEWSQQQNRNIIKTLKGTVTSPKCVWILAPWGPQQKKLWVCVAFGFTLWFRCKGVRWVDFRKSAASLALKSFASGVYAATTWSENVKWRLAAAWKAATKDCRILTCFPVINCQLPEIVWKNLGDMETMTASPQTRLCSMTLVRPVQSVQCLNT